MRTNPAGVGLWTLPTLPVLLVLAGCGTGGKQTPTVERTDSDVHQAAATKAQAHSGWWCDEHGVPEAECSMCNAKVATECKKKGDWCNEHNRAKSQCFLCDPSLEARYARQYEANTGKKMPVPVENRARKEAAGQNAGT
jgi:hypothetical protein